MITKALAEQVDEYLTMMYSPTNEDMDYFQKADDMILDFTINGVSPRDSESIQRMTDELYENMKNIFMDNCGVSPRLLQFCERYYQLLLYYAKANNLGSVHIRASTIRAK